VRIFLVEYLDPDTGEWIPCERSDIFYENELDMAEKEATDWEGDYMYRVTSYVREVK